MDDRRVIGGIIDFIRWSRPGVSARIFVVLAARGGAPGRLMIDATHLEAHRTAATLPQREPLDTSGARGAA